MSSRGFLSPTGAIASFMSDLLSSNSAPNSQEVVNQPEDGQRGDDLNSPPATHTVSATVALRSETAETSKRKRAPKTCGCCHQVGHDRRKCPQLIRAVPPPSIVEVDDENLNDDESTSSSVRDDLWDDNSSDDDDADEEAIPAVEENFPAQLVCEPEDEWVDSPMVDVPFTLDEKGGRVYDLNEDRPPFDDRVSGLMNLPRRTTLPIHFFTLFYRKYIVDNFVMATNLNAEQTGRKRGWRTDLNAVEFLHFLGLVLYFGLVDIPENNEAFNEESIYFLPFVYGIMSPTRFSAIIAMWKFDATVHTPAERARKNAEDSLWSVRDFLVLASEQFGLYYRAFQDLSLDEACIAFKGRHKDRQYNSKKPNKWHFKLFVLSCALTGYCFDFFAYQFKDPKRDCFGTEHSATTYPIVRLLTSAYWNQGYILFTDNWYTSLEVAKWCLSKGIHFIGTIRINRKGLPKSGKLDKKSRCSRGTLKQMCKTFAISTCNGISMCSLYFVAWLDKKPVHLLSTIKSNMFAVKRKVKDAVTHSYRKDGVRCASIISFYNTGMGGTDLGDQKLSYYRNSMRSAKWQVRFFIHVLHMTALNAHILYVMHHGLTKKDKMYRYKAFLEVLVNELCEYTGEPETPGGLKRKNHSPASASSTKSSPHVHKYCRRDSFINSQTDRFTDHHPVFCATNSRRPYCKHCSQRTSYSCEKCKVGMCLKPRGDGTSDSCWKILHNAPPRI